MLSYKEFTSYFGSDLNARDFQLFLAAIFNDLNSYDIRESDYLVSESMGMELGFTNKEAIYDDDDKTMVDEGCPLFSHFNAYPISRCLLIELPFQVSFDDRRENVIQKVGIPDQTKEGYADFLNKHFLVDSFRMGDLIFTVDYEPVAKSINFIQIRSNSLIEHLAL